MSQISIVHEETPIRSGQITPQLCLVVPLKSIDTQDRRFQVRNHLNEDAVRRYQDRIATQGMSAFDGHPLLWENPASKTLLIMDGFHRLQAAQNAGLKQISAFIFEGSEAEATVLAMQANLKHGVPLGSDEVKNACRRIVAAMADKDGNQPGHTVVADLMQMHESTIREWRTAWNASGEFTLSEKIVGKDGKLQAAKKTRTLTQPAPTAVSSDMRPEDRTTTPPSSSSCHIKACRTGASAEGVQAPHVSGPVRVSDDETSPEYKNGIARQNELTRSLRASINALDALATSKWGNVFDPSGTAETIEELRKKCQQALEACPTCNATKAA